MRNFEKIFEFLDFWPNFWQNVNFWLNSLEFFPSSNEISQNPHFLREIWPKNPKVRTFCLNLLILRQNYRIEGDTNFNWEFFSPNLLFLRQSFRIEEGILVENFEKRNSNSLMLRQNFRIEEGTFNGNFEKTFGFWFWCEVTSHFTGEVKWCCVGKGLSGRIAYSTILERAPWALLTLDTANTSWVTEE